MKMKLILSIAFSILTASMLYALEFYDVSRPDIAKIKPVSYTHLTLPTMRTV